MVLTDVNTGAHDLPMKILGLLPSFVLTAIRTVLNFGGPKALSVRTFVGSKADDTIRAQQHAINCSITSGVLINTAYGTSLATLEEYASLCCHSLLLVGMCLRYRSHLSML